MKSLYSPESKKITSWLREKREGSNLTMRQAASKLNLPHSFISKTETGQRRIDVIEFVWYCETLGFDPQEGLQLIINEQ